MGIEATWEWRLLIFNKSSSSLDHISAWVYTHCQPGTCTRMLPCNYVQGRRVCVCVSVYMHGSSSLFFSYATLSPCEH